MKKVPVYNLQTISCKPSKVGNMEILRFEDHLKNIDGVHFPHRHDFYYLLYISSGGGSHTIDFKTYPVKPGTLFFMSPGQMHEWLIKPGTKGFTLFFNKELFSNEELKIEEEWPYFHNLFYKPVFLVKDKNRAELEKWFGWLLTEYVHAENEYEHIFNHLTAALLFKIKAALNLPVYSVQNGKSDIIRKYEMLMDKHFREEQQLTFYALKLNISPNYLNAICKNILAKSAKLLLKERILLEAKRLLHHSTFTINDISEYLNFKTTSYFIRFFKKTEGITPLQFKLNKVEK